MCMVVITSRPTASLLLRHLVDQRIEIIGLAKKEQEQYISESLKGSPTIKIKLQDYLKQHPTINSLLYVPLHLAILMYLFKQDCLPETLTELNEFFIVHTIYQHLTKQRQLSFMKIDKITDLPEPELTIVCQLSKLAYKGLCNSQLVFTYDEIKKVCPKVDETPGAINGFGLLQTVACYHRKGAGKVFSLNFLHFTMQEYLAALHVSTLPSEEQSSLIENVFWYERYSFMWIMYVGIVGSLSTTFIDTISDPSYLCNLHKVAVKRHLFLFQCYLERKDNFLPKALTSIFSDGNIDLSNVTLLPHHIMSLTVFMMRSTTQWKSLNLNNCSMGSNAMSILANFYVDFKERVVTIKYLNLKNNILTSLWGTYTVTNQDYSKLLLSVEDLDISCNLLCDKVIFSLSECLKINSALCKLDLAYINITDEGAKTIAVAIQVNTTLQELNISRNKITDKGAKSFVEAIQVNKTLQKLNISKNWISKEGVMRIVEACTINRTLHRLACTHNNLSKSELAAINEYIRKENAVQIFDASWNSISIKGSQLAIKTTFQLLDVTIQQKSQLANDHYFSSQEEIWFLDEITELKYRREFLQCEHLNVALANLSDMAQIDIIYGCVKVNKKLTEVHLCSSQITSEGIKVLIQAVEVSKALKNLDISSNAISDDGVFFISKFLKINSTLCKLNLSGNKIRDEGTKILSEAIQLNTTLQNLNITRNLITNEGAKRFSKAIQVNKTLQELNISKNWISKEGVMRIVEACTINRTLHRLVCTHNNLSKSELAAINEYIRKENAVQIFEASWNSICIKNSQLAIKTTFQLLDVTIQQKSQLVNDYYFSSQEEIWFLDEITELKNRREFLQCEHLNVALAKLSDMAQVDIISDCVKVNKKITEVHLCSSQITSEGIKVLIQAVEVSTTLQNLDISSNAVSNDGVLSISNFLKINSTLCKLNLSDNKIRDEGTKILSEAIQVNTTLQNLNITSNIITDEGAKRLSKAIEVNKSLQELNISKNCISKEGVMRIVEACTINRTLHKLVCTHNNLSKSGLAAINEYVRKENAVQIFDASWNSIIASSRYQSFLICVLQSLSWSHDDWKIISFDYHKQVYLIDDGVWNDQNIKYDFTGDSLTELNFSSITISSNLLVGIIQQVMQIDTLQKLTIRFNSISDDGAIVFSECLKTNTTLIELDLSGNNIRDKGASAIAEALKVNNTLQTLNISCNKISDDGAMTFSECLKTNTTLIELDLSGNNIMFEGASAIAKALKVNITLQKLNISAYYSEGISDDGAIAFSECLKTNTTLIELDLSGNNIRDKGASAIAEALKVNNTLLTLNISRNKISDDGAMTFSECLKTNTTLIGLDLSGNNIRDKGASAIAEALKVNNTLQTLNISLNGISNDGAMTFIECLKTNTTLIRLDMSRNNINSRILHSITNYQSKQLT